MGVEFQLLCQERVSCFKDCSRQVLDSCSFSNTSVDPCVGTVEKKVGNADGESVADPGGAFDRAFLRPCMPRHK